MIRDYDAETNILSQYTNGHTLGHLSNVEDIINPKEDLETSAAMFALFPLTMTEVEDLERRTHASRRQAFRDRKYDWTLAQSQLESFAVVVEIIESASPSPQRAQKAEKILKQIKVLTAKVASLEEKMRQLAASDDGNIVNFPLPSEYGTTNFLTKDEYGEVMKFKPGKNRLIHCWLSCLRKGKGIGRPPSTKSPLSEEGWKEALAAHLTDAPLTVFNECQHLPLHQILARLARIYEKKESVRTLQSRFDQARRDPKETFECALEKLRILQEKICEHIQVSDKQILIAQNVKHKVMTDETYIPKSIQVALERLEAEANRKCEPFDFETEACRYMSYQDAGMPPQVDDITAGLYSLQVKRPRDDDGEQSSPKRHNAGQANRFAGASTKPYGEQAFKAPPSSPPVQKQAAVTATRPPPKKIVRGRRVLDGKQNNTLNAQRQSSSQKQQQQSRGQQAQHNMRQQLGRLATQPSAPSSAHNAAPQGKALYAVDRSPARSLPTQEVTAQPRMPQYNGNAKRAPYLPYQQDTYTSTYNTNFTPQTQFKKQSFKPKGGQFQKPYQGQHTMRQGDQVSFPQGRPSLQPHMNKGKNKGRGRFPPRHEQNSYTRVYDDHLIDATTTFKGTDTVVTTVTNGMVCRNPRCEHQKMHTPKSCPYRKQNF